MYQEYYEANGNLFYERFFMKAPKSNNKLANGFYREYYKNGVLRIESTYKNGNLHGVWTEFYPSREKKWEVTYFNDSKQGVYKKYYKKGIVKLEGSHIANFKTGEEKRYYENGSLEWKGIYYENNFEDNWIQYDSSKNVINTLNFKKGKLKKASHKIALKKTEVPNGFFENVPIYAGCESFFGNRSQKTCMQKKIKEFVTEKFNTSLAEGLGLEGRQRVNVIFKIDKTGHVIEARASAPHKDLEDEAIRVVNALPKMTPGKQRGKAVIVPYSLPIVFMVKKNTLNKNGFDDPFNDNNGF